MKFIVAVCALIVCCAFAPRVSAQTLTPGELRATAIVANAQVTADAQRQRMDAPTLTPRPTLTPTDTPAPTNTSTPSPTPTETSKPTTPAPITTPTTTAQATVTMALMSAPSAQASAPTKNAPDVNQAALIVALGIVTLAGLALLYRIVMGRTQIK